MTTLNKTVHQLKKGDIVWSHGCKFEILYDAKESQAHREKSWSSKGFETHAGPCDCAYTEGVCLDGEVKGYIAVGKPWTFQGNFKAGSYTVEAQ
jgi:hypothetical protein